MPLALKLLNRYKDQMTVFKTLLLYSAIMITGILIGMVMNSAASLSDELSTKDYWQTIGSLSAGFGTLAILIFGCLKANEWISQIALQRKLSVIDDINEHAWKLWNFYNLRAINFDVKEVDHEHLVTILANLRHSISKYKAITGDEQLCELLDNELDTALKTSSDYVNSTSPSERQRVRNLFGAFLRLTRDELEKIYRNSLNK